MTQTSEKKELFTGLILLTGTDKPGIANALFEGLAPFAVSIIDIDQIIINQRLILTVLISLNPSHQEAIEQDLNELAKEIGVDIACLFSNSQTPTNSTGLVEINIEAIKLHPRQLASITEQIKAVGGNLEGVHRNSVDPINIALSLSGINLAGVEKIIADLEKQEGISIKIVSN